MKSIFSEYRLDSGVLTGKIVSVPKRAAPKSKEGFGYFPGLYRKSNHVVDIEKNEIISSGELISPAEPISIQKKKLISELSELDLKSVRYLIEIQDNSIDDEGRKRLDLIIKRKKELKAILQTVSK